MPLWPANERLEADHLCSGRTIFAQTCMVRGDQLCMHKWSGRTIYDSINGPAGPFLPGPSVPGGTVAEYLR